MELRKYLVVVLVFFTSIGYSQNNKFDINLSSAFSYYNNGAWNFGQNGGAIKFNYNYNIKKNSYLKTGIEIGANGLSNYSIVNMGFHKRQIAFKNDKFWYSYGFYMSHGFLLTHPSFMYLWAIGNENSLNMSIGKKFSIGYFGGIRFYSAPKYKQNSDVYRFWDFNLGLRFSF